MNEEAKVLKAPSLDDWRYYRDKYGTRDALKQFPELLSDPILAFASAQVEAGELAIHARMEELCPDD